ncbi:hypothetical protein VM1G_07528 [Cytospora mali]|uniref:N-acetyltransferase ESCO zinc-finger domain-containing protein n=1 Tax=Cytospora mali TaxID=578113 RepID=A0A194W7I0_CYTMA|nr:hypothetical protein VM1G_07528 [Valsa mali]
MFYPSAAHADCTTACPCQVEDVECVAPPQHEREREREARQGKAPQFDLRKLVGKSHRDDGYGSPTRKTREDAPGLQLEEASLDPDGQSPTPQALDSPTKSCDSISEAEICKDQDIPGSQPHRIIITSSSQAQQMQERSIHEIGAIPSPNMDRVRQPKLSRKRPALALGHGEHGKSGDASLEQAQGQQAQEDPQGSDTPLMTPTQPDRCGSPHAKGAPMEADRVSETASTCSAAALREVAGPGAVGLQDGDQNTMNQTPKSVRRSIRSTARSDANQLITPSTSPASKVEPQSDEAKDEGPGSSGPALMAKAKRRLNLHSGSYNGQPSQKRRKTPPKKQVAVQTTLSLNIGTGAGMRECKVCDTVYNPFHPEDVKVHAKRHAVVLKNGVRV